MKPFISVLIPVYNEEAIIKDCLDRITTYLTTYAEPCYKWELVLVNDGSCDNTGAEADKYAMEHENIRVVHHQVNKNLGNALRTGFKHAQGNYIIVFDLDLSYSPSHILRLAEEIIANDADIVIASPYMKGGRTTGVPFLRKIVSKWSNKYFYYTNRQKINTFTGMVRAYRSDFIKNLSLKSPDFEINAEIIFKAQILRAKIREIPAHLDWSYQNQHKMGRSSGINIKAGIPGGMFTGFIFRPYLFFFIPGTLFLIIFIYITTWIFLNISRIYDQIVVTSHYFDDKFSAAVAEIFAQRPHSFLIGGFCFLSFLLFYGIGFLSLQNKRYFDEMFYLNTKANSFNRP